MKKRFLLILLAIVSALCLVFGLTACGKTKDDPNQGGTEQTTPGGSQGGTQGGNQSGSHTHQFSSSWSSNDVTHWHAATCGHSEKKDESTHTYVNGVCTTCNHAHENHSYGTFIGNESGHTRTCTVCQKTETGSHNYVNGVCTTCYHAHENHSYGTYTSNESGHSRTCSICQKAETGSHNYANGVCTTCNYAHVNHSFGSYTADDSEHTHTCTVCHKAETGSHNYQNGVCVTCNHAHENHVYGEWVDDTLASETQMGSRHKECFCGNRITETTPKITAFEYEQIGNGYAVKAYTGSLTELVVPAEHEGKPVTAIASEAFYDGAFTSIELPASIKEIGESAFGYCTNLQSIEIPNCARIGNSAFVGCTALQEITLPADAIFLGSSLFSYCTALQKVTVKGGTVQSTTFAGAETLKEIILEEGVKSIAQGAFASCKNLQKLTMPRVDTTNSFMRYYFNTETSLEKLTITNQMISVYDKVFEDCTCDIDIWEKFPITNLSVKGATECYIDEFSQENYNLRVEYSDGFQEDFPLFDHISEEDQAALYTVGEHTITVTYQDKSFTATINVRLHTFDEAVLESAEHIYDGSTYSLEVTGVPEGTEIAYTGNGQSEAGEHTVTATLTKQYYETKTLTATLNILKQRYEIFYAFGLENVVNDNPSDYETDGKNIKLKDPVRLGWKFVGWYTEAEFQNKITEIKGNTHRDVTIYAKWQTVFTLNGGEITGLTDYGKQQTELIIDETIDGTKITSVGEYAFYNCSGLTSIEIPDSVTSIGGNAFYECSGLTGVYITDLAAWCRIDFGSFFANPLYYAHHLFLDGNEVKDLTIPSEITEIKAYAFSGCSGLTGTLIIPENVTSIGSDAFYECSGLTGTLIIPDSVTSIGGGVFDRVRDTTTKSKILSKQPLSRA